MQSGVPQLDPLKAEFDAAYLKDPHNPRWVRQTHGGLSLGPDSDLQAVPRHPAPAQDVLVVQEGSKARAPDDGACGQWSVVSGQ